MDDTINVTGEKKRTRIIHGNPSHLIYGIIGVFVSSAIDKQDFPIVPGIFIHGED